MSIRHREYHSGTSRTGTLWVYLGPTTTTRTKSDLVDGWCDDTVGLREQDNALTIQKVFTRVHIINGEEWYTNWQGQKTLLAKYTDCPTYWAPAAESSVSKWALPTESDLLALAPTIVARCNPSRPHIGVPTFIGELRDIPGTITDPVTGFRKLAGIVPTVRNWGAAILRGVAAGHLTWQWAVKPMVGDIRRMCTFVEACQKRYDLIRRLMTSESVGTRCFLGTETASSTSQCTVESQRATLISYRDTFYQKDEWATVRWRMNEITSRYLREHNGYGPVMDFTRRLCLGATSQEALAALWELTPWSWFADWFSDIGDTIAACNNSSGCYPVSICLMRRNWTKSTYRVKTKSSWIQVSNDPQEQRVEKRRWIVPLLGYHIPSFSLPIFTGRQWSILGALAALKGIAPFKSVAPAFHRYTVTLKGGRKAVIRSKKTTAPPRVDPQAAGKRKWTYIRQAKPKGHYTVYTRKGQAGRATSKGRSK